MPRPILRIALLLAVLGPSSAKAEEGLRWMCWLGSADDYNIHCLREVDPVLEDDAGISQESHRDPRKQPEHHAEGWPRNAAPIAQRALGHERNVVWSIPLYSMPFDVKEVALLAQTLMCGSDARCEVIFTRNERQIASH